MLRTAASGRKVEVIKGFMPISLVDWPGKLCSVVFLGGCNFNCPWCHNKILAQNPGAFPNVTVDWNGIDLAWIDGITITGGEPTISVLGLTETAIEIGNIPIKLDTNGSNPKFLEGLLPFLAAVYMDVKAPLISYRYSKACGCHVDLAKIQRSIRILQDWDGEVVFRTTAHPGLSDNDISHIKDSLGPDVLHLVQEYRTP